MIFNRTQVIKIAAINISALQEDSKKDKFCYEQPLFPSYKLTIPKGCKISIAYINGNLNSDNFNGNLNLRLNTGDVTIKNFKGSINAELFSGNFNATIYNTEIDVVSSKGRITTTFPRSDWQKTDISLKGTLGIKKNLLTVQSINANIVLNSGTTQ